MSPVITRSAAKYYVFCKVSPQVDNHCAHWLMPDREHLTTDLNEAGEFDEDTAQRLAAAFRNQGRRRHAVPVGDARMLARRHVDVHDLRGAGHG